MATGSIRRRVWEIVEIARPGDHTSWIFDVAIRVLIALNVVGVVLETIPAVDDAAGLWLRAFDTASVTVFTGNTCSGFGAPAKTRATAVSSGVGSDSRSRRWP